MRTAIKSILVMTAALAPTFTMIGCDDTVSEKTTTDVKSDGTVVKEKEKTTVDHDTGSVTKTTEKDVDKSNTVPRNP